MDLSGRAALITGGKRIGGAVASAFAAGGADVALAYHRSRPSRRPPPSRRRGGGPLSVRRICPGRMTARGW